VNVLEDEAQVRAFFETYHIDLPVLMDTNSMVYNQYEGGSALPRSYLIGPDGSLIKTWQPGLITRASLEKTVSPLLGS
jgi:peroxiredoxin